MTRTVRRLALVLGTVLLAAATAGPAFVPAAVADLRSDLLDILRSSGWRSAQWGVLAVSLENGDTLFSEHPDRAMAPASNMKLVTTAAALHHLGANFRYRTFLLADGEIVNGTLRGDLILYGTGDPGLSGRFFPSETTALESLADQLVEAGVLRVDGSLIGDGSYFRGPLLGEDWDAADLNDWFAAPSSALSFNENVVTFRVEPGRWEGARPIVHTVPDVAEVPVSNEARTAWGRLLIGREAPDQPIRVEGEIALGGADVWRRMTVGDPASYAVGTFHNVLEARGIEVYGAVRTVLDPAASAVTGRRVWAPALRGSAPRVIAEHLSPALVEYLAVVNKESHNFVAEMILKTLGRVVSGNGSYAGGGRVVKMFLAREVGIDTSTVRILDGSGLSAGNRLSAGNLTGVLDHMSTSEAWDAYWSTLPEAGNRLELARMYRTAAAGNLRAKTGTISGVSALSGVVRSANGERIAFSIIGNELPSTWAAKRLEDRIGTRLAAFSRAYEPRLVPLVAAGNEEP